MKRTLLLALTALPLITGGEALAQTKPEVATEGEPQKVYTIQSHSRGGFLSVASSNTTGIQHIDITARAFWRVADVPNDENGGMYFYNLYTGTGINADRAMSSTPAAYYVLPNNVNNEGFVLSTTNPISNGSCIDAKNTDVGTGAWNPNATDWSGTTWVFNSVGQYVATPATLADGAANHHYESGVITLPSAANKIRFTVVSTTNNDAIFEGNPFFTLAEFKLYNEDGTEITLNSSNFSTNAQEGSEGPIANICDGNLTTHFHSRYQGASVGEPHYIEVTLNNPVQKFKFSFDGRNNKRNIPTGMIISTADECARYDATMSLKKAIANITQAYNGKIGSGLNKYDGTTFNPVLVAANSTKNNSQASTDDLTSAKTNLESAANSLSINLPADGQFIRVRATNTSRQQMPYLSSENSAVSVQKGPRAAFSPTGKEGEGEATTIFYYTNGKLLAYSNGFYLANNSTFAGYNGVTEGTPISFAAAENGEKGCYNVKFNDGQRYLYTQQGTLNDNTVFYTDAGSSGPVSQYNFWLEEVETLPVTISAAGYATFYTPVALTIPEGLEAVYTGTVNADNELELTAVTGTLPAGSAVILKGTAGKYDFTITNDEAAAQADNGNLKGQPATINKPEAGNIYTLQNPAEGIGMYKYTGTTLAGFKAYLETTTAAVSGFRFGNATTGIESILTTADGKAPAAIYDLSGHRVEKPTKGLYIINGHKVLFK